MNRLSTERRAAVVRCLVEGNSVRSTSRLTHTAINTVIRLCVDLGEVCALYQHHSLRNLACKRIQCDEIWSFIGAKQRAVKAGAKGIGDVWTWTAMDADSKLMVSWLTGKRNASAAREFMYDLQGRLAGRVQLTTDGHAVYLDAVDATFGANVDFGQLIKIYAGDTSGTGGAGGRYSPPVCIGAQKILQWGDPDPDHVSTSFVERSNLTMRMGMRRFTRLTNGYSRKMENHVAAVEVHMMHYNWCRPHHTLTQANPYHYPTTPAMAAGLTDHVWTVEEICALLNAAGRLG
jgi:YD repeat-containing protein